MSLDSWLQRRPRLLLTLVFIAWKSIILTITVSSPGIGYDTSTDLLYNPVGKSPAVSDAPVKTGNKIFNLVRWDAIYYTQIARRGHLFEQEWAFGKGMSTATSTLTQLLLGAHIQHDLKDYVLGGIVLSHIAHWLSVLLLFSIAQTCIDHKYDQRRVVSFVAAVLHIMSPAGIFLSAPYSEGLFSFLSMLGFYLYGGTITSTDRTSWRRQIRTLAAGVVFGCATIVRSNGILSGLPFLLDAVQHLLKIISPNTAASVRLGLSISLFSTVVGGLCIAVGMIIPQYIAYQEYCTNQIPGPSWCHQNLPSVYTWVQSHYWNNGFLRYWTLSNLPLFALATPVLFLLIRSGLDGCQPLLKRKQAGLMLPELASRLALPQVVLAILTLVNHHVQIITRLASGYPYWYIWLATMMSSKQQSKTIVRVVIMYGLVQAGLYSSFLPPA